MTEIKIGERVIPLMYTTYEMIAIQRDIGCTAFELRDKVFGFVQDEDEDNVEHTVTRLEVATDPEKTAKLGTLIRILGNAGLEEQGKEPDLTDKWILRHIKPGMVLAYAIAVMAEIVNGNTPEQKQEETGPVDEVLEEQNAKKQPGN